MSITSIKDRLKDIAHYIKGFIGAYGFRTYEVGYQYPADSRESALLSSIEGIDFMDDTGYIFMAGRDFMEYASSDINLSIAWDGSRPNVKHLVKGIPNEAKYKADVQNALDQGGGYITYIWDGYQQVVYVLPYDDYLWLGVVAIPSLMDREDIPTYQDRDHVMASLVAQMIGAYIVTNVWHTGRYDDFLRAILQADSGIHLSRGHADTLQHNMAKVPYYPMTVTYTGSQ